MGQSIRMTERTFDINDAVLCHMYRMVAQSLNVKPWGDFGSKA